MMVYLIRIKYIVKTLTDKKRSIDYAVKKYETIVECNVKSLKFETQTKLILSYKRFQRLLVNKR